MYPERTAARRTAADRRRVVSEMRYRQAGRRRGLFRPAPAKAQQMHVLGVLHPVIWLSDGTAAAYRTTFSPAYGNAAREKLYQQQSSISSTPKCSLWLLQITKDLTETMSTIVFRPCSAMLLWLFARMQPPPVMIQMLASPRPGFSADMYLSGSDSFVRPEEDAIALAIEQAWHRLSLAPPTPPGTTYL